MIAAQADLVARWLLVGFIHGVMNTDNTSIAGETIDYGPCAFMDAYHPGAVFSSIDETGRYAYANQPRIAHWNLARFAETLLPLLATARTMAPERRGRGAERFLPEARSRAQRGFPAKLGLGEASRTATSPWRPSSCPLMAEEGRLHADVPSPGEAPPAEPRRRCRACSPGAPASRLGFPDVEPGSPMSRRRQRPSTRDGDANPVYIPRNHLIEDVHPGSERRRATSQPFEALLAVLTRPFEEREGLERYAAAPEEHERVLQTFCGT